MKARGRAGSDSQLAAPALSGAAAPDDLRRIDQQARQLTPSLQWQAGMISTRDAVLADPTRHLVQRSAQETRRALRRVTLNFNPHTRTE